MVPQVLLALGPPQALQGQAAPAVQAVQVVPRDQCSRFPPRHLGDPGGTGGGPVARAAAVVQAAPRVQVEPVAAARGLQAPAGQVVGVVWAAQGAVGVDKLPCRMGLRVAPGGAGGSGGVGGSRWRGGIRALPEVREQLRKRWRRRRRWWRDRCGGFLWGKCR